jgi:hypothetical protein
MNTYFDEMYEENRDSLVDQLPRRPSEYLNTNVFLGHSLLFFAPEEVKIAVRDGYASRLMWGHDYPHAEAPYRIPKDDDVETPTMLSVRRAFSATPSKVARAILGETAVEVHGLDREELGAVAKRINAMTLRQVGTPLETVPKAWEALAKMSCVFPEYRRGATVAVN